MNGCVLASHAALKFACCNGIIAYRRNVSFSKYRLVARHYLNLLFVYLLVDLHRLVCCYIEAPRIGPLVSVLCPCHVIWNWAVRGCLFIVVLQLCHLTPSLFLAKSEIKI